jgi:hypothetical protein
LKRALKAAMTAGMEIARVEVAPDGRLVIVAGKPQDGSNPQDGLDVELEEWREGQRGKG